MFDFTNLVAEYALRVALWPGLGLSLPLALTLLGLRRWLGSAAQPPPTPNPSRWEGSPRRDLLSIAAALTLLASLPLPAPQVNLPLFGVLPSGQQLADPLLAILLLPLASAALLHGRGDALRWLIAWLLAAVGLLALLAASRLPIAILTALACIPLLLISDALALPRSGMPAERWLGALAQQISWLALVALLLTRLCPGLPPDPLLTAAIYGATALAGAWLARLLNRRWPRLARAWWSFAGAAALLALLVALLAK